MAQNVIYRLKTSPLVLSDAAKRRYKKEVIYVGDFEKRNEKGELVHQFSVDNAEIQHWHNTYLEMSAAGIEVPVPVEHTTDPEKKRGVVSGSEIGVNSKGVPALFHYIDFIDDNAARQLSNSDVSIFVPNQFTDGKGKTYYRPIRHVALTDYPVIPGLEKFQPIIASFAESNTMPLRAIAKKLGVADDVPDDKVAAACEAAIDELLKKVEKADKPADDKSTKKDEEKKPIAAGFVNLLRDNRKTKLKQLVDDHRISPAVSADFEKQYCSDDALSLALSHDGQVNDGFDNIVASLAKNEKINALGGERTGGQSVSLSHQLDATKNPLIADAERRAKEAKG